MRWKAAPEPKEGSTRVREVFLWWPLTIGDETRWLEKTRIAEKREARRHIDYEFGDEYTYLEWMPFQFLD